MRPKLDYRTASKESYEIFCKEHKNIHITFKQYIDILYLWNRLLILHLIETGRLVRLPYGFGPLVITKYKPTKYIMVDGEQKNNLPVDWKRTREEGKIVKTLNLHTDGNKYYFAWLYNSARIKCNFIWSFKIRREFARLLAKNLKEETSKYKDLYREWVRKK